MPLDKISPYLLAATIATEDKDYYTNPGFDVLAIAKAVYRAYRYGGDIGGASTITQQLTRALYFRLSDCDKPDAKTICYERTVDRKLREIILSAEISRRYTKDQVLEFYLNEIYYGNLAYGVEAAAQTYFKKMPPADVGRSHILSPDFRKRQRSTTFTPIVTQHSKDKSK